MRKRVTIKDIAKILGLSPSTVSRALRDCPKISEKTRQLVKETAKRLNYTPNILAKRLREKRTYSIGVIIPQINHYFFSSIVAGIDDYAFEHGYNVVFTQSNENFEREKKNVELLLASGIEGVLISRTKETTSFEHFKQFLENEIPIVFFDRICPDIDTHYVVVNDELASYYATKYLIQTGCRRIVHFKGPDNLLIARKRLKGYLEALEEANIPIDKNLIIDCDNFEKAIEVTEELLRKGIEFDGIFAVNDDAAAGALQVLLEHGIKIPDQVSIFGYSNSLISKITKPRLSTVEQQGYKMGYVAAEILIKKIEGYTKGLNKKEVIKAPLIIRETTRKLENFEY